MSAATQRFRSRIKSWRRALLRWLATRVFGTLVLPLLVRSWKVESTDFPSDWLARAQTGDRVILAFWHNRQIGLLRLVSTLQPVKVLVSRHGDGEMIARIMARFGVGTVRGSSTRGGGGALRQMVVASRDTHIGITPDGPVGPRYVVKEGVVSLAALAEIPIFWGSWSARRVWIFSSWDRFVLPKPFARLRFHATGPIVVPRQADKTTLARARLELEERMRAQTAELDAESGLEVDSRLKPR